MPEVTEETAMQNHARLVVIGAGIVGCSAVYHLTQMGWKDIAVLDQGPLFDTGGSTTHAPGLVFQTNFSKMMTGLSGNTVSLYNSLDLDGDPCFFPVGSLEVAYTPERLEDLKRKLGSARSWELEAHLISPEEAGSRLPLLDADRIQGAYYVPSDGIAKAVRACEAMARASEPGAAFHGQTTVTGIEVVNGRVRAVNTDRGRVVADQVLICAGIWGPRIGRMAGISIPLTPVQHLYALTAPLPELAGETREVVHPILRHQDFAMYFRQQGDRYGIGSYRHEPLLVSPDDLVSPDEAERSPSIMEFTPEHFTAARKAADELLPALKSAGLDYRINGLFSFTPDGLPLLGESVDVRGLWVAEAVWITHGGGVGQAVAEWMDSGAPEIDLGDADLNRFGPYVHTTEYVEARGAQQYREVYDIIHPLEQMGHPRGLRVSPFHPRLEELDAVFFENAGWERPQWFGANGVLVDEEDDLPSRAGWEARYWSPIQGAEHRATRRGAGLCDITPFTKIEITGAGALDFLQRIAANRIDRPVGTVIYTALLNARGGIVADLTVTRLAADRFLVLTGAASGMRDLAWISSHARDVRAVHVADVTSARCGLGLWGPEARRILQRVCDDDLTNRALPYFSAREIRIGAVPALALRLSYVGELGWELYAPAEFGLRLWDTLREAGADHGLVALGGGAFDSLRLEKGYRLWGADIHTEYNPYEAGLGWAVRLDKGDFTGRDALLKIREAGVDRKLCCLTLDDQEAVVMGKEPILDGNRVLGYVTSANHGYTVGRFIAYGYLPLAFAEPGTSVAIEYFGERCPATVSREPLYDPRGEKLKS